jgi:hypothetical protein
VGVACGGKAEGWHVSILCIGQWIAVRQKSGKGAFLRQVDDVCVGTVILSLELKSS